MTANSACVFDRPGLVLVGVIGHPSIVNSKIGFAVVVQSHVVAVIGKQFPARIGLDSEDVPAGR